MQVLESTSELNSSGDQYKSHFHYFLLSCLQLFIEASLLPVTFQLHLKVIRFGSKPNIYSTVQYTHARMYARTHARMHMHYNIFT